MPGREILIVDDEPNMREVLNEVLTEDGYSVASVGDGAEAIAAAADGRFDLVILDLKLPDRNGLEVLREIRRRSPRTVIIMITAFSSIQSAIDAMKLGAYDYITKPFKLEKFRELVRNALSLSDDPFEMPRMTRRREIDTEMVGRSPEMQKIFALIQDIAPTNATVLIYGESGTGKELIARAVHQASNRALRPLIKVSCAALPETLLESELFGHEKGAFTGAIAKKPGRFELADTGTIFLDEVGEMSPAMQAKLLRVLQEREFERVGGTHPIKVDVRVIAATNRDLKQEVREGRFREDLYYRLSVVPIYLPPLRERKSDIPILCEKFMERYSRETGRNPLRISDEAMRVLLDYDWPGNIRELQNTIERAVIFSKGDVIEPDVLFLNVPSINSVRAVVDDGAQADSKSLEEVERDHIIEVLRATNCNRTEAARILKITRRTLLNKIKEYGIQDL